MKLPWPDVKVPEYKPGKHGRWTLSTTTGTMPGYFTFELETHNVPALRRREGNKDIVWMSLAPMELESHMPHIAAATGNVVVMGLGMGMYIYNIIQKPDVKTVTVIERDRSVIELFYRMTDSMSWYGAHKVRIVNDDALLWKPGNAQVDFLYCDFWKNMAHNNALRWSRRCVHNVRPVRFGFWTQEFFFFDWMRTHQFPLTAACADFYNLYATAVETDTDAKLIGRNDEAYARLSMMAPVLQTCVSLRGDPEMPLVFAVYEKLRAEYNRLTNGEQTT